MTVKEFLDYLSQELNRSPRTVTSYAEDLYAFEAYFLDKDEGLTWETIDTDIIRDWMESMVDKGNSPSSVARRLSAVKGFLSLLWQGNLSPQILLMPFEALNAAGLSRSS